MSYNHPCPVDWCNGKLENKVVKVDKVVITNSGYIKRIKSIDGYICPICGYKDNHITKELKKFNSVSYTMLL